MGDGVRSDDSFYKPLGRWSVLSYGVGHMLNDITSACWFTYLLVFITDIGLSPRDAAAVMLSGQVSDALTTIFAGELIDRYGHFKRLHAAGSILVAISFSSVFGGCLPCKIFGSNSLALQTIGYSIFGAIFNVGWAATQVSHMSMVNCITLNSTSRVVLVSCRNAFTMVANLSLYGIAFLVFHFSSASSPADIENQYRWIAYSSIFVGCCFVAIFYLGTSEPRLKMDFEGKIREKILWSHWFKKVLYYQVAMVYMLTRLVTNVSQAFLAFYVTYDLEMTRSSKAVVPAIIYVCSFIISIMLQEMKWTCRRLKVYYSVGGILWVMCGIGIIVLTRQMNYLMYILSVFIGVANALMTVTGVSMQSVLVGKDYHGCAFVYGSLSFLDKMSCGFALYILELYQSSSPDLQGCLSIYSCFSITRSGLGLVPGVCALLGVVITYTMDLSTPVTVMPLTEPLLV